MLGYFKVNNFIEESFVKRKTFFIENYMVFMQVILIVLIRDSNSGQINMISSFFF